MKQGRYTPAEDEFIVKHVPRKGHHWVARELGRSPNALWHRADRLGVRFGDLDGWTRISHLARALGYTASAVHTRAERDGVKRTIRQPRSNLPRKKAVIVPNAWADKLLAEAAEREHGDTTGWLTVSQAAKLWRVAYSTANRAANGQSLLCHHCNVTSIPKVRASSGNNHGQWLWEPFGVHRVARELDEQRRLSREWVSTKSISVELDVSQAYVAELGKAKYGGRLLFVRGRVMCHVTPAQAVRLREHLSRDRREAA